MRGEQIGKERTIVDNDVYNLYLHHAVNGKDIITGLEKLLYLS
jgi:hypothetical protein